MVNRVSPKCLSHFLLSDPTSQIPSLTVQLSLFSIQPIIMVC